MPLRLAAALASALTLVSLPAHVHASPAVELVVATVNNGHMLTMQKLTPHFERRYPGVKVRWVTLEEGQLRQRVSVDIATRGDTFDVMTIGVLEAPVWGRKGWLLPVETDAAYDLRDLLDPIRESLSVDGRLYAAPFYGESSMTYYRTDLLARAGLKLPEAPTWEQIRQAAARTHDPAHGVYGICLRGKPGWGENMTLLTTMANSHGGQLFDETWRPQFTTPAWRDALVLYLDLLRRYGPPGALANGYNQNLELFRQGRCAIWVDATVAASFVSDPQRSQVAGQVGFAQAPVAVTPRGAHWLWSWALAIPASTQQAETAQRFVRWATSREYVRLVAREFGWRAVPTGTRRSTYAEPDFQRANPHATLERQAIESANPRASTLQPAPYVGVQLAAIPEFQAIGTAVGEQVAAALAGRIGPTAALKAAQAAAERKMREAGYYAPDRKTRPDQPSAPPRAGASAPASPDTRPQP